MDVLQVSLIKIICACFIFEKITGAVAGASDDSAWIDGGYTPGKRCANVGGDCSTG